MRAWRMVFWCGLGSALAFQKMISLQGIASKRVMPDKALKIVKESLPTRCELCHQSDLFDPVTGICQRCHSFLEPDPELQPHTLNLTPPCPRCGRSEHFNTQHGYCDQCRDYTDPDFEPVRVEIGRPRPACPQCGNQERFYDTLGFCYQCNAQTAPIIPGQARYVYVPPKPEAPLSGSERKAIVAVLSFLGGCVLVFLWMTQLLPGVLLLGLLIGIVVLFSRTDESRA